MSYKSIKQILQILTKTTKSPLFEFLNHSSIRKLSNLNKKLTPQASLQKLTQENRSQHAPIASISSKSYPAPLIRLYLSQHYSPLAIFSSHKTYFEKFKNNLFIEIDPSKPLQKYSSPLLLNIRQLKKMFIWVLKTSFLLRKYEVQIFKTL